MIYFRKFFVKPNDEKWEKSKYEVLALDVDKKLVQVEPEEESETKEDKFVKDDDDEEFEEERRTELMEQDMDHEEQITMFVLIGNEKTGEFQWFDVKDVKYISS